MALMRQTLSSSCAVLSLLGVLAVGPGAPEDWSAGLEASSRVEGPVVRVHQLEGFHQPERPLKQLQEWTAEGPKLTDGKVVRDWIRVDFPLAERLRERPQEERWTLHFLGGLRLHGRPLGGTPDRIDFVWGFGAEQVVIPVDLLAIQGIGRPQLPTVGEDQEEDQLELITAQGLDVRRGWLEEVSKDGVTFSSGERTEDLAWERIRGLALLAEEELEPLPGQVRVRLVDGSDLPFIPEQLGETEWLGRLPWGGRIRLPLHRVVSVDRQQGPFRWLTEVEGMTAEFPQARVLDWSPRFHRNLYGQEIRVAEQVIAQGIAVRAPTDVRFKRVEEGVLTVEVGVDDLVRSHRDPQALSFECFLDGKSLGEAITREVGDTPGLLRFEIPRAGELTLRCRSTGDELASGRHGVWIAPRLWMANADDA